MPFDLKGMFQKKPLTLRDVNNMGYQQALYRLQRHVGQNALQTAQFYPQKKNFEETMTAIIGGRKFVWDQRADDWIPQSMDTGVEDFSEGVQLDEGAADLDWERQPDGGMVAQTPAGTYHIERNMDGSCVWSFWPSEGSSEQIQTDDTPISQEDAVAAASAHWHGLKMRRKFDEPLPLPDELHAAGGYKRHPYGWTRHGGDARMWQNPDFLMNSADWDCPACEEGNHTRCSSSNCDCAKNNHGMKRMAELFGSPFDNQIDKNDAKKLPHGFLASKMGQVGKNAQTVLDMQKQAGKPADPYVGDDGSIYAFPQDSGEDPTKLDAFGLWTDPNKGKNGNSGAM